MKYTLLLTLYAIFIFASPAGNSVLIGPDALKNYEHYLAALNEERNETAETKLKRSLLYKLINITKYAKQKPPKLLETSDINGSGTYMKAFWTLIGQKKRVAHLQNSLREVNEKLSYLSKIVSHSDSNRSFPTVEELQYAFYYRSREEIEKRLRLLKEAVEHNTDILKESLPSIKFDTKRYEDEYRKVEKRLHEAQMELENLKIEKERLGLLGREAKANDMQKRIDLQKRRVDEITKELIRNELVGFFGALQAESPKLFDRQEGIRKLAESLSADEKAEYAPVLQTIEQLSAQRLGKTKILLHRTKEGLQMIEKDLWQRLQTPLFSINEKPISSWNIIVALFILAAGFTLAGLYRRYIRRITHMFINITPSNQIIVSNIGYYLILTVAFFIMLKSMGLDLSSLTLIAGALSVGIGFGLQNIVANFISGIILLFEKSIKIGDFLEINDRLRGRVVDIHMRSITIRTNDNIDILVPNQTFIQNDVVNWTLSDSRRRMRIPFGVAYGSDIKMVKSAILDALQKSSLHYIRDDETKQPMVVMTEMGSSSVNFELFVWVEGDETLKPLRTADKFLVLIYNTLYENGIEIPFPQLDLHVRDIKDRLEIVKREE